MQKKPITAHLKIRLETALPAKKLYAEKAFHRASFPGEDFGGLT